VNHNVHLPESISDHMYRMSIMAFLLDDKTIRRDHCIKMALVHDLSESIVGDITPHDGVTKEDKYILEKRAMERIQELIDDKSIGLEISQLWEEFELGETLEAKFVKDLDKFEMIFQAFEYEKDQGIKLNSFFDSTKGVFQTPQVQNWAVQLLQERAKLATVSEQDQSDTTPKPNEANS